MSAELESFMAEEPLAYLNRVRGTVLALAACRELIAQDEALAEQLRAVDYRRKRVSGSAHAVEIEDLIMRMEANRARHAQLMEEAAREVDEAQRVVMQVNAPLSTLLLARYVSALTWEEVGARIGYSADYCRKDLNRRALAALYWVLPPEWRKPIPKAI